MSETETTEPSRRRGLLAVVAGRATNDPERTKSFPERKTAPESNISPESKTAPLVSFDRRELRLLFDLYGSKVAAGEWRDYAIDFSPTKAVFSVYRRASESPLYRIEKNPELARRQGAFCVVASGGLVMRRGHELARVIAVLQKKLELVRD